MEYQFGKGLIKCMSCGGKYRGKKLRNKLAYSCSTYEKKGKDACSNNFKVREDDLIHIVSTHLKLKNVRVEGSLGEHVTTIEVSEKGYKIFYKGDGSVSIVNDNSTPYGVKFKY